MGIQLRDLASWALNRKLIAGALIGLTLSIGILIGTVISGRVTATHSFLPSGATPWSFPTPFLFPTPLAPLWNAINLRL